MKRLRKIQPLIPVGAILMPLLVSAQTIQSIVMALKTATDAVIPLLMAIAVAVFLWGVVKYITAGGDAEKERAARGHIIFGLLGVFVLVAFWGIVQIITNTFGIETGGTLPQVQISF